MKHQMLLLVCSLFVAVIPSCSIPEGGAPHNARSQANSYKNFDRTPLKYDSSRFDDSRVEFEESGRAKAYGDEGEQPTAENNEELFNASGRAKAY